MTLGTDWRQESDSDLLLLNRALVGGVDRLPLVLERSADKRCRHVLEGLETYDSVDVVEFLVCSDGNRLDKKFISALGVQRRLNFHCLEKNWGVLVRTVA